MYKMQLVFEKKFINTIPKKTIPLRCNLYFCDCVISFGSQFDLSEITCFFSLWNIAKYSVSEASRARNQRCSVGTRTPIFSAGYQPQQDRCSAGIPICLVFRSTKSDSYFYLDFDRPLSRYINYNCPPPPSTTDQTPAVGYCFHNKHTCDQRYLWFRYSVQVHRHT